MDTLYLKIDQNVELHNRKITLGDVGKMICANESVVDRLKTVKLVEIHQVDYAKYTVSVLAIIQLIQEVYPNIEVNNIGEPEFVLTYKTLKKKGLVNFLKVLLVCMISALGSAFAIMTFNSDAGVPDLFDDIYERVMGVEASGITSLEVSYALGIPLGIIVFFNHFFGRKLTDEPTPLEVEMRLYEDDVNVVHLETNTQKECIIDVD